MQSDCRMRAVLSGIKSGLGRAALVSGLSLLVACSGSTPVSPPRTVRATRNDNGVPGCKATPNARRVSAADSPGPQVVKAAAHALWRSPAPHASTRVGVADVMASLSICFAQRDHLPNFPLLLSLRSDRVPDLVARTRAVHPISFAGKASASTPPMAGATESGVLANGYFFRIPAMTDKRIVVSTDIIVAGGEHCPFLVTTDPLPSFRFETFLAVIEAKARRSVC
jgi:hypothetical protein